MPFFLRDLPKFEAFVEFAKRYPELDPASVATYLTLLRVGSDLVENLNALLQQHGLLQGRWIVLVLLMREETRTSTATELAKKAGVTKATMTALLDGLERSDLIVRAAAPGDRRQTAIRLTDEGQRKLDAVMPDYYRNITRIMSGLSERQRSHLTATLGVIGDGLPPLETETE